MSSANKNNNLDTDSLGVIPTQRLLKDLENIPEAKKFLVEYHGLLEDDCNEYERQLILHAASKNVSASSTASLIPLAQYMIVPLSLVRLAIGKSSDDESLMKYLATISKEEESNKIEEKFSKIYCNNNQNKSK